MIHLFSAIAVICIIFAPICLGLAALLKNKDVRNNLMLASVAFSILAIIAIAFDYSVRLM